MTKHSLQEKLYLSGIDADAAALARKLKLGFEITEFCEAAAMDDPARRRSAALKAQGQARLWFHAPFAELAPCAIDPKIRNVAMERFLQSMETAQALGANELVIHDGFIPLVYFPQWFVPQSIAFFKELLRHVPSHMKIALENVMDPGPDMLAEIARGVDDPRLGLCLDIGHANTRVSETKPLDWIAPMAPWLFHIHLHNNDGDWDLHAPLPQGTIPMEETLDALLAQCPGATYTIENMDCTASLRWLMERGYLKEEAI